MLIAEANRLVDDYLRWLRENLRAEQMSDEVVIATPFLDRHSDEIEIYLQKDGESFRLGDDGYTIRDLRSSGVELNKGARQGHLSRILNGFGVQLANDELWVKATAHDFPQKKHNLVQAILAVDDLFITAKEQVVQFFTEDVEEYLRQQNVPIFRNIKLSGKSGFDHHFDIGLPAGPSRSERVLQTINTLRKDTVSNLAFAVQDVRNMRGQDALGAYAMINDSEQPPAPEFLDALRNYRIAPILWSNRERARDLILPS